MTHDMTPDTSLIDEMQREDIVAAEGCLLKLAQGTALLQMAHKRGLALDDSATLVLNAIGDSQRLVRDITERIDFSGQECHQEVRSQAAKIADTVERLERVVLRLQQTNPSKE